MEAQIEQPSECPKCLSEDIVKSGLINNKQRYKCKNCNYFFTVNKLGKKIDSYYIIKALQLYIEGVSYREIERLLGISHVTVMNLVKQFKINRPISAKYKPTYKILNHKDLVDFYANPDNLKGNGMIVTELGDKYMLIKWERFK